MVTDQAAEESNGKEGRGSEEGRENEKCLRRELRADVR